MQSKARGGTADAFGRRMGGGSRVFVPTRFPGLTRIITPESGVWVPRVSTPGDAPLVLSPDRQLSDMNGIARFNREV